MEEIEESFSQMCCFSAMSGTLQSGSQQVIVVEFCLQEELKIDVTTQIKVSLC